MSGPRPRSTALIAELAAAASAILVISSEMPELIGLSDRILVMANGRIVGELGADADEQSILALSMPQAAPGTAA